MKKRLNEVIIGTLFGDAFIPKLGEKRINYLIRWEHCLKQKQYALWKARKCNKEFSTYSRKRYDKRTNKIYKSFSIHLKADPEYSIYRGLFYRGNKKILTKSLLKHLTPKAIAIWYCDDGCLYQTSESNHLTISIGLTSCSNVKFIINYFKDKYDLNFKINQQSIRLGNKEEINKFMRLFGRYIPNCMKRKRT